MNLKQHLLSLFSWLLKHFFKGCFSPFKYTDSEFKSVIKSIIEKAVDLERQKRNKQINQTLLSEN